MTRYISKQCAFRCVWIIAVFLFRTLGFSVPHLHTAGRSDSLSSGKILENAKNCIPQKWVWPTGESPFESTKKSSVDECIQATESGRILSGKYGLVRDEGTKFHEGIDVKSFQKNRDGSPADIVRAFMPGKVVYTNINPSASSYGRYVVVEHEDFLTLYAHLSEVCVTLGKVLKMGEKIGVMGTSSNCVTIPNSRAHLHFEIDFKLGEEDHFAHWYNKIYRDKNLHGEYNGINLVGVNPLWVTENARKGVSPEEIFAKEVEAATVQIVGNYIPWFVKKYGKLFAPGVDLLKPVKGWRVQLTWFGLPFRWFPIYDNLAPLPKIKLISYRKSLLKNSVLRDVLKETKTKEISEISIGKRTTDNFLKMGFEI